MAKKMLIDATHPEETRVVVADGTQVDEFDFETASKRQLAGNIYLAKVTRVEPSLQAAFVDYGGNRHGFLAFAEIHPDYYQIPAEDRKALIEEERAAAAAEDAEADAREDARAGSDNGSDDVDSGANAAAPAAGNDDSVTSSDKIPGMGLVGEDDDASADEDGEHEAAPGEVIESAAEEDAANEAPPQPRRSRARRYKIQEVVKVRQIMLVQVVKEERGNKGAALTTYLSLAGRYCVLMPNTARGGGISRKITNIADRKKLREIAAELQVPHGAGLIIRTAGSQRTKTEVRRDYEYLMRLWEQIRELTFQSVAPAPIYEEGDLIKRSIRDLYSKDIDEVLVEGERGYRTARDFMKMIMPSHARNVTHYTDPMPLFARYQVESYLAGMFNPVVQLKSGGYIVIGVTEALIAIDVNSGRATREGSIEDTAYKTNCEAADEVARQLRLRDLAGLIVIDFIDMDERRNNAAVEKRFKERLKSDRARIQVGRISSFGLMELSRQRLHPGMVESTTQPCAHCHGTGLIRSDDSMALAILRSIDEEGIRKRSREVVIKAPVVVANFLINQKRDHIAQIEARTGMSVMIEADPSLISPDWTMERFKTATRNVTPAESRALSVDADLMAAIDDAHADDEGDEDQAVSDDDAPSASDDGDENGDTAEAESDEQTEAGDGSGNGSSRSSRRRRRRRRRSNGHSNDEADAKADEEGDETGTPTSGQVIAGSDAEDAGGSSEGADGVTGKPDDASDESASPENATAEQAADTPSTASDAPVEGESAPADAESEASADEGAPTVPTAPDAAAEVAAPGGDAPADHEPADHAAPVAADSPTGAATDVAATDEATPAPQGSDASPDSVPADTAAPAEAAPDAPAPSRAPAAVTEPQSDAAEAEGEESNAPVPANSDAPAKPDAAVGAPSKKRQGWWSN